MIGIIILSVWIFLGIVNYFLWKPYVEDEAQELAHIFSPETVRKFTFIAMTVISPYYFVVGVIGRINDYLLVRKVKKAIKNICEKEGIDYDEMLKKYFDENP